MKSLSLIVILLGSLLSIIGAMFKIMDWPDLFQGMISGPILLILGGALLLFRRKNPAKE